MNEELQLFGENVNRFVHEEILPNFERWEKDEITPREIWNQLGEQGLLCVDIDESYGGFGVDFQFSMLILEELSRANCSALATSILVHSDIVAHYIANFGMPEQKERYLPRMVSGDCIGAIAMTEPAAGSDLQGIRTTAKRVDDKWVLNGSKTFITNGQHADVIIVVARSNTEVSGSKGTTLFLVDATEPGVQRGRNLEKLGLHSSDTSELFFENVRVPESSILGELDRGFAIMMGELQRERLGIAVGAVAAAEGVLEETVKYVKERTAFGAPIANFQNTKFELAKAATDIRIHRSFVDECKALFAGGRLDVPTASMAKYSSTEMQGRIVDACLQLFGGYGYMQEYGISRAYADARAQRIYGGTSEIMKELISRSVLK